MVLLAAFPQVDDLMCDLCTSGHSDLVFILPHLTVADIEKARDRLYLFDDTSDLQEVFQLKSSVDSQQMEEVEESKEIEEVHDTIREGFTASGEENDALGSSEDLTNETAVGFARVKLPEDQHIENISSSPSRKCENNEIKATINFEHTIAQADDDPGADFEIMYEESFLGSRRGSFGDFEDSGVKSISDLDSLCNPKSLESLTDRRPVKGGSGGSTRDSGIDFDRSPAPEWKKSASPMVYTCHNCDYKSFTRIMLNRHNLEKHEGSINKRRLTIANTENLHTLSCKNCSFSTKWKQALELHMISSHEDPERKGNSFSKKRKMVFDSPLMRTMSMRHQFKFVKMQSEAKFLKTCFSPETSHRPKRKKNDEIYGFTREFKCHNCDFKTFLQTRLEKHIEADHLVT